MDPFMLRTQLERNNADVEQYSRELTEWSTEMKGKESGLPKDEKPRIRARKLDKPLIYEAKPQKRERLGGVDYTSWEKYDADKECEKLDNEKSISVADYDDVSDETDEENIEESVIEKDKGNNFFKANDFKTAIIYYNKAIDLYSYNPVYFANRAMCYLKLENYEKAEADCTFALRLDKKYIKAYQRRAIARENLNKLPKAKADILRALDFEPSNNESKKVLKRIESKIKDTVSKLPSEDNFEFSRPKSKFALSRQQNKDIKTSYSPPNLIEPISDKIIERKSELSESPSQQKNIELNQIKTCVINSNLNESIKWPEHDSELKEYNAIKKTLKTRYQTVLKKIQISEGENKNVPLTRQEVSKINKNSEQKPEINQALASKEGEISIIPTKSIEFDEIFKNVPTDDFSKLLNIALPKTSTQFYYTWKELNSELKYLYLLRMNPKSFVGIFKDSLESAYFSEILQIMAEEFITRNKSVIPHLYGLSNVKRFSTLTMFKTAEDTKVLNVLMDYIQQDKDSAKFADVLKKKYEID